MHCGSSAASWVALRGMLTTIRETPGARGINRVKRAAVRKMTGGRNIPLMR